MKYQTIDFNPLTHLLFKRLGLYFIFNWEGDGSTHMPSVECHDVRLANTGILRQSLNTINVSFSNWNRMDTSNGWWGNLCFSLLDHKNRKVFLPIATVYFTPEVGWEITLANMAEIK